MRLKNILLIFISIFFAFPSNSNARKIDGIAAVINDKAITISELKEKLILLSKTNTSINRKYPLKNKDLAKEVLDKMIYDKLLDEEVKKRNLEVTDAQLEMFIKKIMQQNRLSSIEELKSALAIQNLSYEQYRKDLRQQIQKTKIMNFAVRSKVSISEQDLKNYYAQNMNEAREPDSMHLKNIFISKNKKNSSVKRQKAKKVLNELKKGASFDRMVKKYSEDSNAKSGGDLGFLTPKDMNAKIYNEVTKLKPGQHTGIIDTPGGYYILKFLEKKTGEIRKFEAVKDELKNKLTAKETEANFKSWLEELRNKAYVDIKI